LTVLIVASIGRAVVPYFTDGRDPGRWSAGAQRLLGLEGPVEPTALGRVLDGRDPDTGRPLASPRRGRRAGWDLVFGAPKSLSILAATHGGLGREIRAAHRAAVEGVTEYLEGRLGMWRLGPEGTWAEAEGLVAAAFDHVSNAASEPHVHTHVLVANLSRSAGKWGAVMGQDWFVDRSALGALYQLELRHHLDQLGLSFDWRLRPDGLADVAGIPRAAVRAASSQSRAVQVGGRHSARHAAAPAPWEDRLDRATAGLEPAQVFERGGGLDDPAVARTVATRLAVRRSDFRRADVIIAVASAYAGGAPASVVSDWADRFCASSIPVRSPTRTPRWATPAARRMDDDLVRELTGPGHRGGRAGATGPVADDLLPAGSTMAERYGDAARALTLGPDRLYFLAAKPGRSEFLAHAELLSVCRPAWERSGLRVEVSSPTAEGARRWAVLAGLEPFRSGHHPDVLVVDHADRRTSSELVRLVRSAADRVVFVEGGTLPRLTNPASHGLVEAAEAYGPTHVGEHPPWAPSEPGRAESGRLFGRTAASELLGLQAGQPTSVLVGLGLEEVRGLNRAVLGRDPGRKGADRFEPGDRVVVLRSRSGLPPYATFGTVTRAGRDRSGPAVTIAWSDGTHRSITDARTLSAVGFGYAVTPWLAARSSASLIVFGPAEALGRGRERVVASVDLARDGPARDRSAAVILQR
jgi:conjugative relaxase-like TrwC/TraI family protein